MKRSTSVPVEFCCNAPEAKAVFVAGSFNDWKSDAAPLHNDPSNGEWKVKVPLRPGHYEYKVVIDGQWCCDPKCEHEYRGCPKCVPNEFGTMNRVLEVR